MIIKIFDSENKNLEALEREAVKIMIELNTVGTIEKYGTIGKYQSLEKISKYNVKESPGMIINNKIKVSGRVPQKEEIKKWIQEVLNENK
ncbi:MAG: thioredoxin family protein [Dethiobacteria bacterium]